jgi:hypothetical protein
MASAFKLRPEMGDFIRWSRRGSCGRSGCADPECVCALCQKPIGMPDEDEHWRSHDDDGCAGCEVCEGRVPLTLFRGEGKQCEEARVHDACFRRLLL